ncbi:thiamine pyrophosphokinase [Coniella lustricola]|uniref:Thiamine pyrophosphokinase n=1 Tax=Coniella lustricola TaxID=2025994 RepID=A0A2T3AJD8_9PEZI|nr:thiamine pyrophosphokinase [Coniella lustricola]
MANPTEWFPAHILQGRAGAEGCLGAETDAGCHHHHHPDQEDQTRLAIIILNQPLHDEETLKVLWKNASLRVAADGGANRLLDICHKIGDDIFKDLDVIIGDLDSLTPEARNYFTTTPAKPAHIIHDPDQYSTDFTKAVRYIRSCSTHGNKPIDIIAMGGLGGRVDQGLSQLHHLYLFQKDSHYADGRMYLVSGESLTVLLKAGCHRIHVRSAAGPEGPQQKQQDVFDKYVGIIPVKEPSVISTKGLEWDVTDWETEFGGLMSTSNHVLPETRIVEVETSKDVLFTIALKR